jgi:hypothetical protein
MEIALYITSNRESISEEMTQITIRLSRKDAEILKKKLEAEKIDFKPIEKRGGFLPYGWIEIVIQLTAALIPILYDLAERKRNEPRVKMEMKGTSFKLNADNIKKLELELTLDQQKKREGQRG